MAAPAQSQVPDSSKPKLVLFITVDAMRPDDLSRFEPQLTDGLGRLHRGGAVFTNAFQDHAITETAPGHSATMSGRFPVDTRISANSAGVSDTTVTLIDAPGPGASPFRFRGTTLIDWLVAKDPRTRVLSVSRKDRAATPPVGSSKQPIFWYYGNDVKPGRYGEFARVVDIAPTLAAIVHAAPQEKLDGHLLQNAIR